MALGAVAFTRPERPPVHRSGGHNVLLLGPPGAGKSMLARRLTTIRPEMSLAEALETTRIHRGAGRTHGRTALVTSRPCRAPHHPISEVGRVGGGQMPMPGEGSLAHHGVLFLDELPECRRHVLAGLRQPLEEGVISERPRGRPGPPGVGRLRCPSADRKGLGQGFIAATYGRGGHEARCVTALFPPSSLRGRLVLFA